MHSQSTPNQTLLQNDINALFNYGNSWDLFFNNTSISIQVQILLLTTSIIWKYPKKMKQKIQESLLTLTYVHWDQHYKNIMSRFYKCLYLLKRTFNTYATASKHSQLHQLSQTCSDIEAQPRTYQCHQWHSTCYVASILLLMCLLTCRAFN